MVFIRDWEAFSAKNRENVKKSKRKITIEKRNFPKRVNPLTGEEFVLGDLNEEATHFFYTYGGDTGPKGYRGEKWHPVSYKFRYFVRNASNKAKQRARKSQTPFNITLEYLMEIWPSDGKCPVLGIDLVFLETAGKKRTRQHARNDDYFTKS
ncbi:MAG: hypothetical protein ACN4FJ_02990 [Parvibaculales bacterium]